MSIWGLFRRVGVAHAVHLLVAPGEGRRVARARRAVLEKERAWFWGSGFGGWGLGFSVKCSGLRVQGFEFGVWGSGFAVCG